MIEVTASAEFNVSVDKVWDIITNNKDYSWRSDLQKVEIFDHSKFIETDKKGICTTFTITKKELHSVYEFDIQNKNLSGSWVGKFTDLGSNKCSISLTETLNFNSKFAQFMAKTSGAAKKFQAAFIADLRTAVQSKCESHQ